MLCGKPSEKSGCLHEFCYGNLLTDSAASSRALLVVRRTRRCALPLCKPSSNQQGRPIFAEPARAEGSSAECHTFPLPSMTLALTGVGSRTIHGLLLRTNNQLGPPHCLHCGSPLYPKASQDGHAQTQKPEVIPVERGGAGHLRPNA